MLTRVALWVCVHKEKPPSVFPTGGDGGCFAEVVGFEPTVPLDTPVFKTGAIVRSATLPCACAWS